MALVTAVVQIQSLVWDLACATAKKKRKKEKNVFSKFSLDVVL